MDVDGDGKEDAWLVDVNDDGVGDAIIMDVDGDGNGDVVLFDANGNDTPDFIVDLNGDVTVSTIMWLKVMTMVLSMTLTWMRRNISIPIFQSTTI